ncbi:MAG TPA: OmpW family outer membrane protein, partial [Rhodocyclaceae bacterium]|nr:OmpW family outer membrane protein [Rhodocyclaceae bacterium]
ATLLVSAVASFGSSSAMAQQVNEGNWLVRVRALSLEPADKSDPISGTGAADRVGVENKIIPEVDVSYFWTKNIATELVLTVPQRHDVTLDGTNIGSFKHLPPSLLVQYHFNPEGQFRPYVGVGINYTIIGGERLANNMQLENSSVGAVVQAGFDVKVSSNVFLNFDVKKIQLRSDLYSSSGDKLSTLKLDPLLWGVGIGYRF